jgi:hypothetical protein
VTWKPRTKPLAGPAADLSSPEFMRRFFLTVAVAAIVSCAPPDAAVPVDTPTDPFIEHVLSAGFVWVADTTEHFVVRAIAESYAHQTFAAQTAALDRARHFVLLRLGEDGASQTRAHVFLLRSRDDVAQLVGQPAGGWTEPQANSVLAVVSDSVTPPLRHELGHLYSHRLWGRPHGPWISEGVALFAVGHCAGRPLHQWAAAIQRAGESVSLDPLLRNFDFSRAAPHLLAGSFVTFVADRHGIEAVKALWRRGAESAQAFTSENLAELEAVWHEELGRTPVPHDMPAFRGRVRCETSAG